MLPSSVSSARFQIVPPRLTRSLWPGVFFVCLLWLGSLGRAAGESPQPLELDEFRRVLLPEVTLESAAWASPPRGGGRHVEVKGNIGGHIKFELLLPENWNGRFVMGGGGGFVGTVQNAARDSVQRGYATAGTDTGHQWQPGYLAGWALTNLEAQVNFGFLAVHRTAEVAKALIRTYYGQPAKHSYFVGCSRGGGQAMMEAQRYPKDFDGIVAGAPAFDWTGLAATMVTIARELYPDPGHLDTPVLTREALQKLQAAILDQGDAQDGLKDGVIQDPSAVRFDLGKVAGLSAAQRQAIEIIYTGARNTAGPIAPGYPRGVECDPDQWILWLTGPVPGLLRKDRVPSLTFAYGTQIFKYLVFNDPDWDYSKYDFEHFARDTRLAASFLNATNPDLSAFKARRGKLILWHGWADPALPARTTEDYYGRVLALDPAAAEFCRLFLIPGCFHCGGGPGAAEVDWLAVMVDWVEEGRPPDRLIAARRERGETVMTRPLFPYPKRAVYNGVGNPNHAESFAPK